MRSSDFDPSYMYLVSAPAVRWFEVLAAIVLLLAGLGVLVALALRKRLSWPAVITGAAMLLGGTVYGTVLLTRESTAATFESVQREAKRVYNVEVDRYQPPGRPGGHRSVHLRDAGGTERHCALDATKDQDGLLSARIHCHSHDLPIKYDGLMGTSPEASPSG